MSEDGYRPEEWGAKCDSCPLRAQGATPVAPQWASNLRGPSQGVGTGVRAIIVVGDSPGMHDVKRGKQFIGPAGVKLDEMLWNAGLKRSQVLGLTTALLCRPEAPDEVGRKRYDLKVWMAWWRKENVKRKKFGERLMANPFECCAPRLQGELEDAEVIARRLAQNLVVMPVGNFALAALQGASGKAQSIAKYRGSVIEKVGHSEESLC